MIDRAKLDDCVAKMDACVKSDDFKESEHPRDEDGKFSVTIKAVPHHAGTHHNINEKRVKTQKHEVHVNGEHIGHVQTHVKHVEKYSVGRMRPTGKMQLGWSAYPKGRPGETHHGSKKGALKSVIAAFHGYKVANNLIPDA